MRGHHCLAVRTFLRYATRVSLRCALHHRLKKHCCPAGLGAFFMINVERMQKRSAAIYEAANTVAQQSIGQIRTVAAYGQQSKLVVQYGAALEQPYKIGIKQGIMQVRFWARILACLCQSRSALAVTVRRHRTDHRMTLGAPSVDW